MNQPIIAPDFDAPRLLERLKAHEGYRSKPYRCTAGKLTIGYGRNLDDRGLDEVEAAYLLERDLNRCYIELNQHLDWWPHTPILVQQVLLELCFNLGVGGLLGFRKMLREMLAGNWEDAAKEALGSLWAKQVGPRAQTLTNLLLRQAQFDRFWDELDPTGLAPDPTPGVEYALTIMLDRLGPAGLKSFRRMLSAAQAGAHEIACREMNDSKWARENEAEANRLTHYWLS